LIALPYDAVAGQHEVCTDARRQQALSWGASRYWSGACNTMSVNGCVERSVHVPRTR